MPVILKSFSGYAEGLHRLGLPPGDIMLRWNETNQVVAPLNEGPRVSDSYSTYHIPC